jgi:hypothetical protein
VRGGLDAFQELVQGDAVGERSHVDHLAVTHLHEEGVGVLVRLAVDGDAAPVPQDDHRVPVGVD